MAHLWPLAVLVGIFVFLNTHPIRPHDFWWHMAAGREIVTSGYIPKNDMHSFTAAGSPYPAYQIYWLAETAFYLTHTIGGPALIVLAHSVFVTGAYSLTLWLCYQTTHDWRIAALATFLAAALGINDWNVRPQAFTFWLAPLFLLTMRTYRQHRRRHLLAVFPLGMLLWVNSHGTFFIGILLTGIWLADELWQVLATSKCKTAGHNRQHLAGAATALATAMLACLLNPRGLGIITYIRDLTSSPVVQQLVPEWAPPTFSDLHGSLFLLGLLSLAAILAMSPKRPTAFQLVVFLGFALLGLRTTRGAIWFGLITAPVLADHTAALARSLTGSGTSDWPNRGFPKLNGLFAALLALIAVTSLPWFKEFLPLPIEKAGLISHETPVAATEFLLIEHPPGPLFNDMAFGSYLAWAAQPAYPVFVDPRIELYDPAIWLDYLHISAAQDNWDLKLANYNIRTLMLSSSQSALIEAARDSGDWTEIYCDDVAVILTQVTTD